jgi:hypothetical protein
MRRIITVLASVGVATLISAGAAGASTRTAHPAGEASALGGCVVAICGSVMNESSHVIWAIRDFDSNGPAPGTEWRLLNPGQQTPSNQDWDGFYVECKASGRIASWVPPGVWVWSDFNLPAGYWMKIHTEQDAHVRSQSC